MIFTYLLLQRLQYFRANSCASFSEVNSEGYSVANQSASSTLSTFLVCTKSCYCLKVYTDRFYNSSYVLNVLIFLTPFFWSSFNIIQSLLSHVAWNRLLLVSVYGYPTVCQNVIVCYFIRLQFRFAHHQAAMIVALRQALDFLLVRAATNPATIAEPSHEDERILHVVKALSRANAGSFNVSRGGGQFQPRGGPLPGYVKLGLELLRVGFV